MLISQNYKITKGMCQDIDVQSVSNEFAFRLFNIKAQVLDSASSNNLTNEKGNSRIRLLDYYTKDEVYIAGTVIGVIQCTVDTVVIFTYVDGSTNYIYKLVYDETKDAIIVRVVAYGNFNIPITHISENKEIQTEVSGIFSYENSEVQKVYWVDGVNQLRYLNIADSNKNLPITDANKLNSNPEFKVNHHIEVERVPGGGVFTPGTIQYAFTYFDRYGAETNIVDMTPLYYIGEENRGVREDQTVGCSFKVTIKNPDTSFDCARIYSIQRAGINAAPLVKIVGDVNLK